MATRRAFSVPSCERRRERSKKKGTFSLGEKGFPPFNPWILEASLSLSFFLSRLGPIKPAILNIDKQFDNIIHWFVKRKGS